MNKYNKLAIILIILSFILTACSSKSDAPTNSSPTNNASATGIGGNAVNANSEAENLAKEKAKLEQEKAKLEKENQSLKDEKAKTEKLKDATPPSSEITNTVSTVNPPSNIRDSPNGKILCVVKKQATMVKIYGSTDITDNNGEWFYTKHCGGKIGVIHSSQFVSPG